MRAAVAISLNGEERANLEGWLRSGTTEQRLARRARIVLAAAKNRMNKDIAAELGTTPAQVSKWRSRFARKRLEGLSDAPRPGQPAKYDADTEKRILAMLDEPPPYGYSTWSGSLLAKRLDIHPRQVWRVLARHGIALQRRRSWCISTDPEFAPKAADIVGLYLAPPENAVVLCVDEKPHIQALERAQGWLRLPNGKAVTGFSHEYKRHGTSTLFAALNIASGQLRGGHYRRRRRREFLDFMNRVVADYPDQEIHVVLDNLNTHKPKHDRWLARHTNVRFHYTPTRASWLNQVEIWFSILSRRALKGASFTSPQQLRQAMDRFIEVYNETAIPFEWTKTTITPRGLTYKYSNL